MILMSNLKNLPAAHACACCQGYCSYCQISSWVGKRSLMQNGQREYRVSLSF
jgi:hypothetical protein